MRTELTGLANTSALVVGRGGVPYAYPARAAQDSTVKQAAKETGDKAEDAKDQTVKAADEVGDKAEDAKDQTVKGTKKAAKATKKAAKEVGDKAEDAKDLT